MKATIFAAIKVVSSILMSGAIVLQAWDLTLGIDWAALPGWFYGAFWYARCAAAIHLVEGIAAAVWVTKRPEHQSLSYGIYTFFVGTVGLQELWDTRSKATT